MLFGTMAMVQQENTADPATVRLIRLYPNPATTFIQFEFSPLISKNSQLQIYNFLGKKMLDIPASMAKTRVDLTPFTRGIYIYQLKDRNGKTIESGKFQIEK
jgi:hypothetical protein